MIDVGLKAARWFLVLALTTWGSSAYAQSFVNQAPRPFAIPPQSVSSALLQFSETTNQELMVDERLTHGKQSQGVSGTYTPEAALDAILAGTGLTYRLTTDGAVTVIEAPAPQSSSSQANVDTPVDASQKPVKVPEIVVKDVKERETNELNNPPPDYPGGQVASGGRVGILGNRNIMDTPFTQMNYTSRLIQDQQARFLGDVLRNDPSVQFLQPTSTGFMGFAIRGFQVPQGDSLFNGLAIAPNANSVMMTEGIERVEVLRGPNALLNGAAAEGSLGGMVNLVPKRAGDEALTRLTGQYLSDTQAGGHVDIGRRFGANKQFGVRINGAYRNGNLSIDHAFRESALATAGFDYRGDFIRLSADFGYQEQETRGARRQFNVANNLTALPEPPNTQTNASQPWELNHSRALFGTLRSEIDISKYITAFADFGTTQDRRQSLLLNRQIIDSQGTLAAGNSSVVAFDTRTVTFNVGLRSSFNTGPIHHQAVGAYTLLLTQFQASPFGSFAMPASNIYNPVFGAPPPSSLLSTYGSAAKIAETNLSSGMIGDTLSILEGRVQVTGGVRFQKIKTTGFDQTTGAVTEQYDDSAPSPMVGVVVKPWQRVSFYGHYIEALQTGPTAPLIAANAGQVFSPFRSKGYEVGVKVDFGRLAATLAGYQITQPSAFINPATNVFGVDGERRHRGIEFTVFGEVTEGLRLLGGTSYIDAELTSTQNGVNQGNRAPVAPFQLTVYGEWDLPFLKALTLTSRVTHGSSQYVNFANTLKVPGWAQWDLGARYRLEYVNGKPITIRAFLENVLDNNAWYGSPFAGQIIPRDPRTFLLSATIDF